MKRIRALGSAAALALITSLFACHAFAQEEGLDPASLDPEKLEAMMREYAKPGEAHANLKRYVGEWKTEAKHYFPDPEKPSVSEGAATFKMVLGGRFVQQDFSGEFEGQKMTGFGLTGYDNAKKKYVSIWTDSMSTGFGHGVGEWNHKTDTYVEHMESDSPMGKMKMRLVTKHLSDDKFVMLMHWLMPGDTEMKTLEIAYTRKK